jgi:hypothetical protein
MHCGPHSGEQQRPALQGTYTRQLALMCVGCHCELTLHVQRLSTGKRCC